MQEYIHFTDTDGKKRIGLKTNCRYCNKEFAARLRSRKKAKSYAKFCCKECCRKWDEENHQIFEIKCDFCQSIVNKRKFKPSKTGLHFCSRQCKDEAQKLKSGITALHLPHYSTGRSSYRNQFETDKLICKRCGYNEFSCSVDIHHIDKNRDNNHLDNLIPLCANCHTGIHRGRWKLEDLNCKDYKT